MDVWQFWTRFVLAALATWRVTHLLAYEDGPADIAARVRARLANSIVGGLIDCFGCLSIWVAIPFAFAVALAPVDLILSWLALSGAAFLLERMRPEPLVVERLSEPTEGMENNGMLRSDTAASEETAGR
jgi:Protein of unknown function (DUF1360)